MKVIALTGADGNIGRAILKGLQDSGFKVISCVQKPGNHANERLLELKDKESCLRCFKGVDIIIHMAYFTKPQREYFVPDGIDTNIKGMYNLYEAARMCGVKRVIFGSSLHVFGFYGAEEQVTDFSEYKPDSMYGLCKCWGELIGKYYSERFGISCINLRIGHCRGDRDIDKSGSREFRQWISNRDMVQLIIKCIEADESFKYKSYPAISNNEDLWSLERVKAELGYQPMDDGRKLITKETCQNDTNLKGGYFTLY